MSEGNVPTIRRGPVAFTVLMQLGINPRETLKVIIIFGENVQK